MSTEVGGRLAERPVTPECVWRAMPQRVRDLMYPLLDAVNAYATLQEMMDVLREVWGEYYEPLIV